jgi:hypothetical protein
MGAFDSFGRSLNADFEKRPPWPIHHLAGFTLDPGPRPIPPALAGMTNCDTVSLGGEALLNVFFQEVPDFMLKRVHFPVSQIKGPIDFTSIPRDKSGWKGIFRANILG